MQIAAITDPGKVRSENQDNYRAVCLADGTVWAVVCDGMGGTAGGKLASHLACQSLEESFSLLESCPAGNELDFVTDALKRANTAVWDHSQQNWRLAGMGTTVVSILVRGNRAFLHHAGDSRCYRIRGGKIEQLTKDHSYVQELVDCGTITKAEAEHHPQKNMITRAVGVDSHLEVTAQEISVQEGDLFMLCSDGLTNMVPQSGIMSVLKMTDFYNAPKRLADTANRNGGNDNITVLLLNLNREDTE